MADGMSKQFVGKQKLLFLEFKFNEGLQESKHPIKKKNVAAFVCKWQTEISENDEKVSVKTVRNP